MIESYCIVHEINAKIQEDKKRLEEFVEAVMKEQTYEQLTLF